MPHCYVAETFGNSRVVLWTRLTLKYVDVTMLVIFFSIVNSYNCQLLVVIKVKMYVSLQNIIKGGLENFIT